MGSLAATRRKWLIGIVVIVAALAGLYWTALPGDLPVGVDADGSLAGTYTVNGVDPTGVEYSGTAVIAHGDSADVFTVDWIVTGTIQTGTGRLDHSTFIVDWETVSSAGGTGTGTAIYTLESDGRLVGSRTIEGLDEPGTEELFPEA